MEFGGIWAEFNGRNDARRGNRRGARGRARLSAGWGQSDGGATLRCAWGGQRARTMLGALLWQASRCVPVDLGPLPSDSRRTCTSRCARMSRIHQKRQRAPSSVCLARAPTTFHARARASCPASNNQRLEQEPPCRLPRKDQVSAAFLPFSAGGEQQDSAAVLPPFCRSIENGTIVKQTVQSNYSHVISRDIT